MWLLLSKHDCWNKWLDLIKHWNIQNTSTQPVWSIILIFEVFSLITLIILVIYFNQFNLFYLLSKLSIVDLTRKLICNTSVSRRRMLNILVHCWPLFNHITCNHLNCNKLKNVDENKRQLQINAIKITRRFLQCFVQLNPCVWDKMTWEFSSKVKDKISNLTFSFLLDAAAGAELLKII